jgi:hypothetical protein
MGTPQGFDFTGIGRKQTTTDFDFGGIAPAKPARPVIQAHGVTDPQSVRVTEPSLEDMVDDPIGRLVIRAAKKLSPVLHAVGNWIAPEPEAPRSVPATPPQQTAGRVLSSAGQVVKGAVEFPVRVLADASGITQSVQRARGQAPTGVIGPSIGAQLREGAGRVKTAAVTLAQAKTPAEQEAAVNDLMFRITALPADTAGIPVSEIREAITSGDYTRAAGLALGTAAVFGAVPAAKGAMRASGRMPVEVRAEVQRLATGEPRDLRAEAASRRVEPTTAPPAPEVSGFDFGGIEKRAETPVQAPAARPTIEPRGPAPVAQPAAAQAPGTPVYAQVKASDIRLDPGAYQFKASDARGETGRLRDVRTWDTLQAQTTPVLLHERGDGTLYVADGHQRVNLAKRLEAEGQSVPPLNAVILREADGWTAPDVRRAAALINVRQDSASPIDIAKLLRERPLSPEDRASIPRGNVQGERFRQAEDIAKLGDPAFQAVVNGEVEPALARFVGREIGDPAEQLAAIRALRDADLPNAFQAEQFVKGLKSDEFTKAVQDDLFGEQVVAASLAKEKAQILDAVRRQLQSQKSAFGNALRNESRLRDAGNVLATGENERLAGEAGRFQSLLNAFVDKAGHTGTALREAARKVADGQAKAAAVSPEIIAALEHDWRESGGTAEGAAREVGQGNQGDRGPRGELPPTAEQSPAVISPRQAVDRYLEVREWSNPDAREPVSRIFRDVAARIDREPQTMADLRAAGDGKWIRQALDVLKQSRAVETRWDRNGDAYYVKAGTNRPDLMTEAEIPAEWKAPGPAADVLDTGEVQPRLPGAEGVRDQNIPTPEVADVPFSLNAGKTEGLEQASRAELEAAGQKDLFASMGTSGSRRPRASAVAADTEGGLRAPTPPVPPEMRQRIEEWLAGKGGSGVVRVARDIENTFSAPTVSQEARTAGNLFRMKLGELAHKGVQAEFALREVRNRMDRLSREQTLALADAIESGEPLPKEFETYAKVREKLYDQRKRELARLGLDKEWMEHYLPHAWESGWKGSERIEGKFIREWFGHRTLEGGKHFLKKREIPTMREGVEAGFEPVSWNLVDLDLLKLREMDKYVMARQLREELKAQGLIKFGSTLKGHPEGLVQIDDPIGTVHAPPTITIKEAYDQQLFSALEQFANDLGIAHTRKPDIGGKRWGYASTLEGMVTKFGGPETVLMHEIGHFLDWKYNLAKDWIGEHPFSKAAKANPMQAELRALADLRAESQGADIAPSFKHYIRRGEEKIANLVHAYIWNPERARQVAPNAYAALDGLVNRHPELRPLRDLQKTRSLELGTAAVEKRLPGPVLLGHYYARPEVARLFNNYLRPGLAGRSAIFDAYRWIGNNLNQLQLGFSAFHAGTSAINAVVSKVALALEHVERGQLALAGVKLAEAPLAWFTDVMRGAKAIREYETANPGALTIADATRQIIEAGGRVRMEGMYTNQAWRAFSSALRHPEARRKLGALVHVLPAAVELAARPVMQWYVPRLKIAAFLDLAEKEMARLGPAAELGDVRDVLARSWDSIDGRFGQLVYDNLFWSRVVKDLGMASVRSLGWNLGSFMELGGGFKDIVRRPLPGGREVRMINGKPTIDPVLSHRTAHLVGLTFTAGLLGALYQVAHTGEWPATLRDYFFPKTGRQKPDGDDERVALPSYMKDLYSFSREPVTTAGHKLHPELAILFDTWHNEDYYGNEIRNPDDPLVEQAQQYFTFLAKQLTPISVRAYNQRMKSGATVGGRLESAVGISPASALVSRSAAEEQMREYLGPIHRTFDQAKVAEQRREYRQGLQQGDTEQMEAARATGLLTPESVKRMKRERDWTPLDFGFRQLTIDQALRVYAVMTPEERLRFRGRLEAKFHSAHLPPAERQEMRERMERARTLPIHP